MSALTDNFLTTMYLKFNRNIEEKQKQFTEKNHTKIKHVKESE